MSTTDQVFKINGDYRTCTDPYEIIDEKYVKESHKALLEYTSHVSLKNSICQHFKSNKGVALTACLKNVSNLFWVTKSLFPTEHEEYEFYTAFFKFIQQTKNFEDSQRRVIYNLLMHNIPYRSLNVLLNADDISTVNIEGKCKIVIVPTPVSRFETGIDTFVGVPNKTSGMKIWSEYTFQTFKNKEKQLILVLNDTLVHKHKFPVNSCVNVSWVSKKTNVSYYGRIVEDENKTITIQMESDIDETEFGFDSAAEYTVCVNCKEKKNSGINFNNLNPLLAQKLHPREQIYNFPIMLDIGIYDFNTYKLKYCEVPSKTDAYLFTFSNKNPQIKSEVNACTIITRDRSNSDVQYTFGTTIIDDTTIKFYSFDSINISKVAVQKVLTLPPVVWTHPAHLKIGFPEKSFYNQFDVIEENFIFVRGFFSKKQTFKWDDSAFLFDAFINDNSPIAESPDGVKYVTSYFLMNEISNTIQGFCNFMHLFHDETRKIYYSCTESDQVNHYVISIECDLEVDETLQYIVRDCHKDLTFDEILKSEINSVFVEKIKEKYNEDQNDEVKINYNQTLDSLKELQQGYGYFVNFLEALSHLSRDEFYDHFNKMYEETEENREKLEEIYDADISEKFSLKIISDDMCFCSEAKCSYRVNFDTEFQLQSVLYPWFESTTQILFDNKIENYNFITSFKPSKVNHVETKIFFIQFNQSATMFIATDHANVKKLTIKCLCQCSDNNVFVWKTHNECLENKDHSYVCLNGSQDFIGKSDYDDQEDASYDDVYCLDSLVDKFASNNTYEKTNVDCCFFMHRQFKPIQDERCIQSILLVGNQLDDFINLCNTRQHVIISITSKTTNESILIKTKSCKVNEDTLDNCMTSLENDLYDTENLSCAVIPFNPLCNVSPDLISDPLNIFSDYVGQEHYKACPKIFLQVPAQYIKFLNEALQKSSGQFTTTLKSLKSNILERNKKFKLAFSNNRSNTISDFLGFYKQNAIVIVNGNMEGVRKTSLCLETTDSQQGTRIKISNKTYYLKNADDDPNACIIDESTLKYDRGNNKISVVFFPISIPLTPDELLFKEYILTLDNLITSSKLIKFAYLEFKRNERQESIRTYTEDMSSFNLNSNFLIKPPSITKKFQVKPVISEPTQVLLANNKEFRFDLKKEFIQSKLFFQSVFNTPKISFYMNSTDYLCNQMKLNKLKFLRVSISGGIKFTCLNPEQLIKLCKKNGGQLFMCLAPFGFMVKFYLYENKIEMAVQQFRRSTLISDSDITTNVHYSVHHAEIQFQASLIQCNSQSVVLSDLGTFLNYDVPLTGLNCFVSCCKFGQLSPDFSLALINDYIFNLSYTNKFKSVTVKFNNICKKFYGKYNSKKTFAFFSFGSEFYWKVVAYFIFTNNMDALYTSTKTWPTNICSTLMNELKSSKDVRLYKLHFQNGTWFGIEIKSRKPDKFLIFDKYNEIICLPDFTKSKIPYFFNEATENNSSISVNETWPRDIDADTKIGRTMVTRFY